MITARLRGLREHAPFARTVDLVDGRVDGANRPEAWIGDLSATAARLYLANVARGRVIEFIHGITSANALRTLVPYVTAELQPLALRYGWQLVAALYASAGDAREPEAIATPADSVEALVKRAVETGDDHAVKLAQACLVEYRHTGEAVFLAALGDAVERLHRRLAATAFRSARVRTCAEPTGTAGD